MAGVPAATLLFAALAALIVVERLGELVLARANRRHLLAAGAVEAEGDVYPWLVALHALFVPAMVVEFLYAPWAGWWWPAGALFLLLFAGAQALRYWAITSLGRRWTTRILVLPGRPLVATGPYRHVRHPNYVAIIVELAALPLAFRLYATAAAFTAANALLLSLRVRAEERALREAGDRRRSHGATPPGRR